MSSINTEISNVLAQIRALSGQIESSGATGAVTQTEGEGFGTAMKDAIDAVSNQQKRAEDLTNRFQAGDPDTSIAQVVVEMQKASISFQAMSEARNRIVDAYREIMNMSV